jgi:3-hydroxybutyryl-CoA dehydrogenase
MKKKNDKANPKSQTKQIPNTPAAAPIKSKAATPAKGAAVKKGSIPVKKAAPSESAAVVKEPMVVPAATAIVEAKPAKEAKPVKQLVCLLGDEGLVKEYSAMFQSHGIAVLEMKNLSSLKTSAKKITAALELTLLTSAQKVKNLQALDEALPESTPIVTCSVTSTVLLQTHELQHRSRWMGIAAFPTLLENPLVELTPSLHTSKGAADAVTALFTSAKKETALVQDSVGMVMPRILCQIINEALFTVQQDVASPSDIDEAMKHGTNYPHGPIAWGEKIGFANVSGVLDAIYEHYREDRYRTAPLLRQLAIAGVYWKTE